MIGGVLCSFTFTRVWHTICYSPKMVYFTAQECEENEEGKGRTDF